MRTVFSLLTFALSGMSQAAFGDYEKQVFIKFVCVIFRLKTIIKIKTSINF